MSRGLKYSEPKSYLRGVFFAQGKVGLLQQVEDPRSGNGLGTALHVQFAADVGPVMLNGANAYE